MGLRLETVLVDSRRISVPDIAETARQLAAKSSPVRSEYTRLYLFISPAHPNGMQFVWPLFEDEVLAGEFINQMDLARELSRKAGQAVFFSYTDTVEEGEMTEFLDGVEGLEWESEDAGDFQPLSAGLRKHFELTFEQLIEWFDQWSCHDTYSRLYPLEHERPYQSHVFQLAEVKRGLVFGRSGMKPLDSPKLIEPKTWLEMGRRGRF